MGLRFDISSVNWVAYLLHPTAPVPRFTEKWQEKEMLKLFLQRLADQFHSGEYNRRELNRKARMAEGMLLRLETSNQDFQVNEVLKDIKLFFSDFPWTALIIPSGIDSEIDNYLCSVPLLEELLNKFSAGLLLQPEEVRLDDAGALSFLDVFPAFRTALAESANWPGILIWVPGGDSAFLPFGSFSIQQVGERAKWVFANIERNYADLEDFKKQYIEKFPDSVDQLKRTIHFVQISDLHIGSKEASLRLSRVEQLIRNVVIDLGPTAKVVPLVSGDILDSPSDSRLWEARRFLNFLADIGTEEPVVVLGNHDVRGNGVLNENFRQALKIQTRSVTWYKDDEIGLVGFNSVRRGRLARGFIGEEQFIDIGNEIDRERKYKDFLLLGMLHHHPIPVDVPDWYARPFYERVFGNSINKTDNLEDAPSLLQFANRRNMVALLHGHKHIPRATKVSNKLVVFGCGSTVGKVSVTDGGTYMSLNVISVNKRSRRISGRLLAERFSGGGLIEEKRHELILRINTAQLNSNA